MHKAAIHGEDLDTVVVEVRDDDVLMGVDGDIVGTSKLRCSSTSGAKLG